MNSFIITLLLFIVLLLFNQSPVLVLWNQLENWLVMTMPCATKLTVVLRVYAKITILVMAGLLDQAVKQVINN